MSKNTSGTRRWFFQQLVSAVDYLHKMVHLSDADCQHSGSMMCSSFFCKYALSSGAKQSFFSKFKEQWQSNQGIAMLVIHMFVRWIWWLPFLQGFASRDIKLDNVLLDGSRRPLMKLCDFGYSKVCFRCNKKNYRPRCKPAINDESNCLRGLINLSIGCSNLQGVMGKLLQFLEELCWELYHKDSSGFP